MFATISLRAQPHPLAVALALVAATVVSGDEGGALPRPGIAQPRAQGDAAPDYADFSAPIASFFSTARFSERLLSIWPASNSGLLARWETNGTCASATLSHEIHPSSIGLGRWVPQSRRERQQDLVDYDDLVGRAYYDVVRVVESLGKRLQLDRSYYLDVELQETTYGTRLAQDPHDVKTVLSFKRLSLSVPIYHEGLTEVSLELNAGKLYQAVTGKNPLGLRGGLTVRF